MGNNQIFIETFLYKFNLFYTFKFIWVLAQTRKNLTLDFLISLIPKDFLETIKLTLNFIQIGF